MATGRQKLNEEKDFYEKLDKESHGNCCTCPTMVLFFVGLFIIGVTSVYFLSNLLLSSRPPKPQLPSVKLSTPTIREVKNDSTHLILTDNDLQSIIWGGAQLLLPLSEKKAYVLPEGIALKGNVPAMDSVEIILHPTVESGKLIIQSVTMKHGSQSFAQEFSDTIKNRVGDELNSAIKKRTSMKPKSLNLEKGRLIIEGESI